MTDTKRTPRSSSEHDFAGITGAYKAVTTGYPARAAYLMWRWASSVALAALLLYVVVGLFVRLW